MYLFDTDILSNLFKKTPSRRLLRKLEKIPSHEQFVSTITIGEIVFGAVKSDRRDFHLRNLIQHILPVMQIVSFDLDAAMQYGQIRADLEMRGKTISHADLQIAAIALSRNLILVSGNESHFRRIIELRLENWL
jgi:tRNA(fMet)-specific endonuclease VapC